MADSGIGQPQDSKATDTTGSWSVIALLKKLIDATASSASGDATAANQTTQITAANLTNTDLGIVTETAPATDTASSGLNGRLQRVAQRITTLLAVFPTTLDTNSGAKSASTIRTVHATDDTMIGALTETAPASDTASSGLNGRLQRIAQNITTLISSVLKIVGNVAVGVAASGNPVLIAGKDTAGNVEYLFTDTTGRVIVVGAAADGAAVTGNPVLIGGFDGTNVQTIEMLLAGSHELVKTAIYGAAGTQITTANSVGDTQTGANTLSVHSNAWNGGSFDRKRSVTANTVLASAARTGTVSTDVTNFNGRTIVVILNITVAPNTASTLTLQIRLKDSISSNYITLLASVAIVGTATTGVVPVTNRYAVALGETVAANVAASMALGRTMNVNVVHSNADSWTYSISADIGV